MSRVDLGFSQECEPWQVESYLFPSKIGGKPAWLDLENLPLPEHLQCSTCHQPLIFLCQVYAPFEEDDSNFHRTVFVFICRDPKCCVRNSNCNIKVFRCSLPRYNKFYSAQPPNDRQDVNFSVTKWIQLCDVCGCLGPKKCSKCHKAAYCSKDHQVIDWKEGHKNECQIEEKHVRPSKKLFSQSELVIEAEELKEETVNEDEELKKFNQLKEEGKVGTMNDTDESDIEKYAALDVDKVFSRFKKRIGDNSDQVLRYERGGEPLWIAAEPKPEIIPNCEYCTSPRQYEFQIMPQLLAILHEHELDIGIIVIYTCSKSCTEGETYKQEFAFKQDVMLTKNC